MSGKMVQVYLLLLIYSFHFDRVDSADGLFYMQRLTNSCSDMNVNLNTNFDATSDCLTYDWSQIFNLTTSYTTYKELNSNVSYTARIGALTVLGNIANYSLNYVCPPLGYNGVGPGCFTPNNTQLVVLKVGLVDQRLYSIDIILSGVPFPNADSLQDNRPPFGKARITFTNGIALRSNGYFKVCRNAISNQCPNTNIDEKKLPYPLPSNYGYGIFGIQSFNYVANSTWIMDDLNRLLIVTAGPNYYYFNNTGFFLYDATKQTCEWSTSCDYVCEVYNYNSRFLDYSGEWIITEKWGYPSLKPLNTEIWIGNAIDAAGIFPVIMYTDKLTGDYLGLDKLDPAPAPKMGATYWYGEHGPTKPKTTIEQFTPNVVQAGCVRNLQTWTGAWRGDSSTFKLSFLLLILSSLISFFN